jgi:hypothetical protein
VDGAVNVATPSLSAVNKSYRAIKTKAPSNRQLLRPALFRLVSCMAKDVIMREMDWIGRATICEENTRVFYMRPHGAPHVQGHLRRSRQHRTRAIGLPLELSHLLMRLTDAFKA